ncbi:MAG: arylsulfatase family protein, partial [Phycisphaerales bacterium]|nr:arylsulfatase family protein [Phycisphaerales bacterium]
GYSDLGCFGSEISTPNIDSLAKDGVAFTQFYNQSRCCPTRAALLTGRWPHQVGIGEMIDGYAKGAREKANSPAYDDHLSIASPTIPELLRPAGYTTLMSGKWHLGYRWAEWPFSRGFDHSFVLVGGATNYFGGMTDGPRALMATDDQVFVPPHDGFYTTDAFTDHAVSMIDDAAKAPATPFFLYLAYNAPHWPLQAPDADIAKYAGVYDKGFEPIRQARFVSMVEKGIVPAGSPMAPPDRGRAREWEQMPDVNRQIWIRRMQVYAAQIDHLDQQVGRVLAELKKLGIADNTLVVFLSDNGGAAEDPNSGKAGAIIGTRDSFRGYDRPWASVSNTPWRLHKTTSYEGGISTPLLARWPSGIPANLNGTLIRSSGHVVDLLPTILDVGQATYATKAKDISPEGRSLLPVLQGKPDTAQHPYFWEHEGNRAVRDGQWKLVMLNNDQAGWHLYDINADRVESHDVAAEHSDVAKRLAGEYDAWATRVGVQPRDRLTNRGEPAAKHDE